ncbi:MAG: amidohydrolase family protein, partial [Alphaproteobacteria bacterium]
MSDVAKESKTTMIRGRWIVAFDGREHRILEDGVVVFRGDSITHVGKSYAGKTDDTIDAGRHLVIPGLVNTHVHVGSQSGDRMILDAGRRDLMRSGFLNYYPTKGIRGRAIFDFEDRVAAKRYSLASLLRYGSTTVVEMGEDPAEEPGLAARLAGELGMRIYTSPGYS